MALTIILICERCGHSICVPRGDLPDHCERKGCVTKAAQWRVAIEGELTKSDRRFLRSIMVLGW